MKSIKEKVAASYDAFKGDFGYTNKMQAPRLVKVMVSSGVGSVLDKKRKEMIGDRLAKITGQKAVATKAKKSIAGFKLREGEHVGYQTTLRGARMLDFLEKIVNVALPRTRDFRGISPKGIDAMGNYSFGIKEHTIFPEAAEEDVRDVFGLGITIVTNCKTKKECEVFMRYIGLPLQESK
jgi:large subunit ribosomal protein L5